MSSSLSQLPVAGRRHGAFVAGLVAVLCAAVGLLPWVAASPLLIRVLSVPVLVVAIVSALIGWGLLRSVGVDTAAAHVDAAVRGASDVAGCDCGHEHDPDELHVTDSAPCDDADVCAHDCAACVLQRGHQYRD